MAFGQLLKIIKKMLLKGNELPTTTYEANLVIYHLGLEIQKIYACPNGRNTRIWMHVRYVRHHGIRSGEMILAMLRVKNVIGRKFLPRLCGMLL